MKKVLYKIKSDEGSMLLLTLITITVLIILGVSALNVATTEAKISSNEVNRQKAQDLAEAGIAHASTGTSDQNVLTVSDGNSQNGYSATRIYTPSTLEYFITSTGTANGISKTIQAQFYYIKDLSKITNTVIADNLTLQQSGSSSENKGEVEKGSVIANSQANISGNIKLEDSAAKILIGPQVDTSGILGIDSSSVTTMDSTVPVPQIDINYYKELAGSNILSPGSINLNTAPFTNVNGYKLFFVNGDLTIPGNLDNSSSAIIIATGNISIQGQLGSESSRPVLIYSGNNVTLNGLSTKFEVQGVIMAKNSINITNMSEIAGTLIAPTVSVTGSNWELKYFENENINKTDFINFMQSIKLTQNKKVASWTEN